MLGNFDADRHVATGNKRLAAIDIDATLLAECLPTLGDAGLSVVDSLPGPGYLDRPIVRLVISAPEWDASVLPDECLKTGLWLVRLIFIQETYGKQKLVRIDKAELIERLTRSSARVAA